MAKKTTDKKPLTKSQVMSTLAESTGLPKKDVSTIFEELGGLIGKQLGRRGPGTFTVPGLMKVRVVRKPATKAREGRNPFTGEMTTFAAKPARNVVKITPLKGLKDMV